MFTSSVYADYAVYGIISTCKTVNTAEK